MCIIVLVILFTRTIKGVDWQLSQVFFSRIVILYICYCLIDVVWSLFEAEILENNTLFFFFYPLNYIVTSLCSFYWFVYSESMQGNKEILEAKVRFKYALPLIIVLAIGLIFFSILEFVYDSTLKGPFYLIYYLITAITPIFYIFNAFIKSLKRCGKKKFSETRNLHVIMALYPIILFLSAILQIIYIDLPIICYVIVIALLCIYFRSLDNLISIDALTKLNKRNQIYSHIARISREVVFIDAD